MYQLKAEHLIASVAVLLIGLVLLASVNKPSPSIPPATPQSNETSAPKEEVLGSQTETFFPVTEVVDGDTIKVRIDGQAQTVRLIGVDTPETVAPGQPVECFGIEASNFLKDLLIGKSVELTADPTQDDIDKYGRLLRYVYMEDATFVNHKLILEGYAYEYTYDVPYESQSLFQTAQAEAENENRGLWGPICEPAVVEPVPAPTPPPPPNPAPAVIPPAPQPVAPPPSSGFVCNCSKLCTQMASCQEAYFQLNSCGCGERDSDNDGIPCESIC
jgi:micrococcal nuclease